MTCRESRQDGFTLVELLISLALLAVLSAFALNALTFVKRIDRAEQELTDNSASESSFRYLRQAIGDTRVVFQAGSDGSSFIKFAGGSDRLSLVTVSSDATETGGLYELSFVVDEKRQLVSQRQIYRPNEDSGDVSVVPLISDVSNVSFRYFGNPSLGGTGAWLELWERPDALPFLIEVSITFMDPSRPSPPRMIVPVEAAR